MNLWWLRGRGGLLSHSRWRYRGTRGGHLLKVMILKQKMKVHLNRHSRALTLTRLISWEKKIHLWGDVLLSTMHGAQGFILDFSTHLVFLILHLCHSLTLSFSWPPLLLVAPTEAVFQNLPPTPAVVCNLIQLPVLRSHVGVPWRHSRVRIIIGPDLEEENFQIKTWHTVWHCFTSIEDALEGGLDNWSWSTWSGSGLRMPEKDGIKTELKVNEREFMWKAENVSE